MGESCAARQFILHNSSFHTSFYGLDVNSLAISPLLNVGKHSVAWELSRYMYTCSSQATECMWRRPCAGSPSTIQALVHMRHMSVGAIIDDLELESVTEHPLQSLMYFRYKAQ